jgi:hypothetical protein
MLSTTRPRLAVEVGGSPAILRQLAARAGEVHCIAVEQTDLARRGVVVHNGPDPNQVLADLLRALEDERRTVDLLLVEAESLTTVIHSLLQTALGSGATGSTWIVVHGVMRDEVRAGTEALCADAYPKVRLVALECVPGRFVVDKRGAWSGQGGLGLIVTDRTRLAYFHDARFRAHEDVHRAARDGPAGTLRGARA